MTPTPAPIALAKDIVTEHALYELVLAAIEERCSSFALDDEADQQKAAEQIAAALIQCGVRL